VIPRRQAAIKTGVAEWKVDGPSDSLVDVSLLQDLGDEFERINQASKAHETSIDESI